MKELLDFLRTHFYFEVLDQWGLPLVLVFSIFLFFAETVRWLRKRKLPGVIGRWSRIKTNAGLASLAFLALRLLLIPVLAWIAQWAEAAGIGLLHWVPLPLWLAYSAAFCLLDYGNYLWHIINHKSTFLWRFHNVHHIDLDLDVTTAVRFHFGEVLLSAVFRSAVILLVGAPYLLVLAYEVVFEAATNFHHSNWRLPFALEKTLSLLVVTPRMHGIHHSIVQRETNSNYSVVFNCWDRLHRTIRLNVRQDDINIGVPAYRKPDEQTFFKLLLLPFCKQRPWQLPDGKVPERDSSGDPGELQP